MKDDAELIFKERQKEIADIQKMKEELHNVPIGETNVCLKTFQKLIKQRQKNIQKKVSS